MRSQDRTTLIRSYEIYISEYGKDSYVIKAKRTSHILGAYNTFERALEVLDEIQNILFYKKMSEDNMSTFAKIITDKYGENVRNKLYMNTAVYEMPKE